MYHIGELSPPTPDQVECVSNSNSHFNSDSDADADADNDGDLSPPAPDQIVLQLPASEPDNGDLNPPAPEIGRQSPENNDRLMSSPPPFESDDCYELPQRYEQPPPQSMSAVRAALIQDFAAASELCSQMVKEVPGWATSEMTNFKYSTKIEAEIRIL